MANKILSSPQEEKFAAYFWHSGWLVQPNMWKICKKIQSYEWSASLFSQAITMSSCAGNGKDKYADAIKNILTAFHETSLLSK